MIVCSDYGNSWSVDHVRVENFDYGNWIDFVSNITIKLSFFQRYTLLLDTKRIQHYLCFLRLEQVQSMSCDWHKLNSQIKKKKCELH